LRLNLVKAQWVVARVGEHSKPSVRRRNSYIPAEGTFVPGFQAVDIGDGAEKSPRDTPKKARVSTYGPESNNWGTNGPR